MKVVERIDDLRHLLDEARAAGQGPSGPSERERRTVGFVPTMGFFHEGHRSLMRAARRDRPAGTGLVVVSLFVNPTQFGVNEDLDAYPRDLDGDSAACADEGVDILFAPSLAEMYPGGVPLTSVRIAEMSEGLCGAGRPAYFSGMATVVTKLLSIVGPCTAYFGRKDFQQLAVIRRLVHDLSIPVEVVGCPLVREPDGVAMSSRNAYLDERGRAAAAVLFRALRTGVECIEEGERDAARIRRVVANAITAEQRVRLEYVEVVSAADMSPIEHLEGEVLVAVATRIGDARLIDNVTVRVDGESVNADLGVFAGAGVVEGKETAACAGS